ncbi:MAG TPA: SagB/ThcOx family dehydrogenase [Puia sp.]|nr:SagB/ThcOx family dehydrogenase [Puia sp.]
MFRSKFPSAWTFHRNTCRNELNTLSPVNVDSRPESYKEYLGASSVPLPDVKIPATNWQDVLLGRYSCRRFRDLPVSRQDLANVLFAGYGLTEINSTGGFEVMSRTIPSGGGLYPLEFYLLVKNVEGLAPGIYHYVIMPALLEQVREIELPRTLVQELFMQQPYVADASVVIIASSVIGRTMKKYEDRGYRYILFEAGHAFQNMNLMASACKLGSFNIGGFFDLDLARVLNLEMEEEIPLYAMALGIPDGPPDLARIPPSVDG